MDIYLRCAGAALLSIILTISIRSHNKEVALVLSLAVCCLIAICAVKVLQPVIAFIERLYIMGNLDRGFVSILLKIVGIGLVGELSAAVCADSGNSAVAKTLQILSVSVILYLALPLFTALLELIERILGNL